jgi:formylglycine-generating enzyme required for sulfatase activity
MNNKINIYMGMKRLKRAFLALAALPLLFFASCSEDDLGDGQGTGPNENGGDIRFEIGFAPQGGTQAAMNANGPQTRAATAADFTSMWEDGDEIGVFACTTGGTLAASGNPVHNVKLTYSGGLWIGSVYWPTYSSGITAMDFYAYYPYDISATDPTNITFNVKADQGGTTSGKSNHNLSDLLTAKTANKGKGETVSLSFNHALAMVQVSIPGGRGWGAGVEGFNVTLRDMKPAATLNLGAVDATPGSGVMPAASGNDAASIKMFRLEQPGDADYETSYTYRALVPAQGVGAGNSLFLFEHEGRTLLRDGALASVLTLTAGTAEKFERTMPPSMIETVAIPAGTFLMGSSDGSAFGSGTPGVDLNATPADPYRDPNEIPQHKVTLTKDFYMSRYQVTKAQYTAFLNATGVGSDRKAMVNDGTTTVSRTLFSENEYDWTPRWNGATQKWDVTKAGGEQHPGDVPMLNVTWYGAKAYADWIGGSLPTEAQWEYACRAGTTTAYSFGDDASKLDNYAWYVDNKPKHWEGPEGPGLVGTKSPNPWGLYDMHGNVQEWCSDWYASNYYSTSPNDDPTGPASGSDRVLRGGTWNYAAWTCRSAFRYSSVPDNGHHTIGFRVAVVP